MESSYISTDKPVSVAIVEDYGVTDSVASLRAMLSSAGIERTYYRPDAATISDVQEYDVLVSASIDHTRKQTLLNQAYAFGKGIITFSTDTQAAQWAMLSGARLGGGRLHWNQNTKCESASPNQSTRLE